MAYDIQIVEREEQPAAIVRGHADQAHIGEFVGRAFGEVAALAAREQLDIAGAPFGRFTPHSDGSFDIEAGFPVTGQITPEATGDNVEIITLDGGPTARTIYAGPYDGVGAAYEALGTWLKDNGYVLNGTPWESYLDEPDVANPRTEVYFPITRQPDEKLPHLDSNQKPFD